MGKIKINLNNHTIYSRLCRLEFTLAGYIKAGDVDIMYEKIASAIDEDTVVSSFIKVCCNHIAADIKGCENITDTNIRYNDEYNLCFHGTSDEVHVAFRASKYFDMDLGHIENTAVIEW